MPPHQLTLRAGMVLVLMRNIDQYMGLCNGTRLQLIGKCGENLKCTVLSGPMANIGGFTLIPRVRFEYGRKSDEKDINRFVRIQYPVIPAFAMTINKAQGQTLERVGLHLGTQVFSHGQVYTAFSRVTSRDGIRIYNDRPKRANFIVNRVYEELLDKRSARTPSPTVPADKRISRDQWSSIPGLGSTPPAAWTRGVPAAEQGDTDYNDGRAPDITDVLPHDGANDFDWACMEFDLDENDPSQPPDRNAFNHKFLAGEQVDIPAWDNDDTGEYIYCEEHTKTLTHLSLAHCKITLIKSDITKLHVDAIVNAANERLQEGSGVCGAIFRAAGPAKLKNECDLFGRCSTGDAVITAAYDIKNVRSIIHAVGPIVKGGRATVKHQRDLGACYTRSLDLAKAHGLRSIVTMTMWRSSLIHVL
jgi:hypothetical protein